MLRLLRLLGLQWITADFESGQYSLAVRRVASLLYIAANLPIVQHAA